MSRDPTRSARAAAGRAAASPAVAGFRPQLAAAAVAAAFSLQPQLLQAQPSGARAIHGQASVATQGRNVVVRTTNGAGTAHSAIDWQSFSVPAGSTTRFIQPSAASTSINRVVGGDPSAIYGTLSSNGKLVLVNPAGIAVGAGGVVDTAGFTASTLSMREADAIAGRLVFQGPGGPLQVDGHVLARGGDIVLVGSRVQVGSVAVVQSDGATLLAAGERVALTGRGLEGIQLEVRAGNEAVNLGRLQGDAVGIFAGTLRHSGHIAADAATSHGGKVVLKATGGDAHVNGSITAAAGDRGGRIDVLGERVALEAGALLRANGSAGGGQVRVGGDYQGANADVPNARRVYMDAAARIEADATRQGDGGRVIVWSDEVTRMHGNISARGGSAGGDGGFAEVSGKKHLEFTGLVDLRAPQGRRGQLLLDPEDIHIVHEPMPAPAPSPAPYGSVNTFPSADTTYGASMFEPSSANPVTLTDRHLNAQLASSDVRVKTSYTPDNTGSGGQITMDADAVISWSTDSSLMLEADKGMTLAGRIETTGAGGVYLLALGGDITQPSTGKITTGNLVAEASGLVSLLGPNQIGTVAGTAGGEFFVKNAQSLTVGTAATFHATRSGITAGSVRLETTGADTDINVAGNIQATAGGIVVDARRHILGNGFFNTDGGAAGSVYLHGRGGDVRFSQIDASGTSGAQGGAVTVMAQRDVIGNLIRSNGGDGTLAAGGQGGKVYVKYGGELKPAGTLAPLTIEARGGAGGIGDAMPGGNAGMGGQGGEVLLENPTGDLRVAGGLTIVVAGGQGGDTSSGTGAAGHGSKGGRVILAAKGKTVVDGVRVDAMGGSGGSASVSGLHGSEGLQGYLDTRSAITEVQGWLELGAIWDNTRVLNVVDGGDIYGYAGLLRNAGEINLSGTAYVSPGAVENSGLIRVKSGEGRMTLAKNTGTVDVLLGAALYTDGFMSNAGTLNVDGTLGVGTFACGECGFVLASADFTNEATGVITGTGTLLVDDGMGLMANDGKIAPGGVGSTGKLTIDGSLQMNAGSVLHADVVNLLAHDILAVTGSAATGGSVEVNHPAGTRIAAGDTFAVLQAGALDASTLPTVGGGSMVASASGNDLLLRATAAVPAPAPAPAPGSQQQAQQQVLGEIVTFQQLFEQALREDEQGEPGRDDIVVTDTACAPR